MSSRPGTARDLTKRQREEYREAFDMFDRNRDGKISPGELGEVMKSLGFDPTKEELKDMIGNADLDGSKHLEFDEFLSLLVRQVACDDRREDELRQAFMVFDKNRDNYISRKELKSTMHQLGEKMSDYEIDMIIREADLDRDGRVNYHEFVRVVAKKY